MGYSLRTKRILEPRAAASAASSPRILVAAPGSEKSTVPSATARARGDQLESVEACPDPTHADDRQVHGRRARPHGRERDRLEGRPEYPPVPRASSGRSVRSSSASPRSVFTSESPSAPAASTARATSAMSHAAGESFA